MKYQLPVAPGRLAGAILLAIVGCNEAEVKLASSSNTLAISQATTTVLEGDSATFGFIFLGDTPSADITIDYTYTGSGTLTGNAIIPANSQLVSIRIKIPDNKEIGLDTVGATFTLDAASGGFSITSEFDSEVEVDELDDVKELAFVNDTVTVSEAFGLQGDTLFLPLSISNPLDGMVTVDYSLRGTAIAGSDYTLLSDNPLILPAGTSDTTINFLVLDDLILEDPSPTLYVTLDDATPNDGEDNETFLTPDTENRNFAYNFSDDLKVFSFAQLPTDTISFSSPGSAEITLLMNGNLLAAALTFFDVSLPAGVSISGIDPGNELILGIGQSSVTFSVTVSQAAIDNAPNNGQIEIVGTDTNNADQEVLFDPERNRINISIVTP